MQASIRKYRVNPEQMDEVMRRIDDDFAGRVEGTPGFAGYHAVDCGHGILTTVTLGHDPGAVERSVDLAAEFVRDELADMEVERVEAATGEVGVTRGG
jgi:hypothetical protein